MEGETEMVYSYTQISQYLRCPRSYRYRYLDGWQEKETRSGMAFGRCFENALGAYFREEDCGATFFKEWGAYRDAAFEYKKGETWDRLLHQGIHLLETFARDNRVRIHDPHGNLQVKKHRILAGGSEFVAYLDAIGEVDGVPCLIDWKTTTSRYPEAPEGLLSLDPQLICYSWISGILEAALVVFVRKHANNQRGFENSADPRIADELRVERKQAFRCLRVTEGLLSLDPQLICYSWISGILEAALVVFVRKHAPEIQYL